MFTFAPRNSKLWLAATSLISAAGIGVLCGFEVETSPAFPAAVQETEFVKFDSEGNLLRPEGYREWIYVGTPLTPNDLNNGNAPFPDFHNVYIDPVSWGHYKATGKFREGTVLVKELVSVGSKQAVSGNGYFMGEFIGLETTVKSAMRFPNEPGNWAYFSFGHEYPLAAKATAFPAAACNACHAASAADDFVFTQYYPVLRAAKGTAEDLHDGANCPECLAGLRAFEEASMAAMQPSTDRATGAAARPTVNGSVVPTEKNALFRYLQQGRYKSFAARESAAHPSFGPHTSFGRPVLTYVNSALEASLQAGNESHPAGSEAVKEMFNPGGELIGWAVASKTQADSDGGNGWFWYEVTSTMDGSNPVAIGNGIPLCFGCHSAGRDYFLSPFPLK